MRCCRVVVARSPQTPPFPRGHSRAGMRAGHSAAQACTDLGIKTLKTKTPPSYGPPVTYRTPCHSDVVPDGATYSPRCISGSVRHHC